MPQLVLEQKNFRVRLRLTHKTVFFGWGEFFFSHPGCGGQKVTRPDTRSQRSSGSLLNQGLILSWCSCFLFIYWLRCTVRVQNLSPPTGQGLNSGPQAVKAQSPKHRTPREALPLGALRQGRKKRKRKKKKKKTGQARSMEVLPTGRDERYCPLHTGPAQARITPGLDPPGPGMYRAPQARSTRGPPETIPHRTLPPAPKQSCCKNHTSTTTVITSNTKLTCVCVCARLKK